ncbi:thermonuclease family protein [Microbulbifer discodermiae]|uniref:thermonuclease family protein n=1 Tax=Microbulbifer sp. 2201CG32-9 TaxID=3232309 RepID=UPI00345B83B6
MYIHTVFLPPIPGQPDIVGKLIGVRVKGVDTPELRGKCQAEKELARKAKQFTATVFHGAQEVRLEEIERVKYFRLLAEVWVDGKRLDRKRPGITPCQQEPSYGAAARR